MTAPTYICIDLKSFYASVECVERGLDPMKVNLVVADPERSKSTICLAISPAMKQKGVPKGCRMHEIPPGMEYITAIPRMQLYLDYSAHIYSVYLRYVAPEDIHVYSIDECFIDVTQYLELYQRTPEEMAFELMRAVMEETGITATAGVGTNLYLAKIAMDIMAKHAPNHIGVLDEQRYREKLWEHRPLSDFWRIGGRTQRRLAQYGIHTMGDIARMSLSSEDWLFRQFGIDAELLIDHAWGFESCRMEDIQSYHSESHSLSNGQVLMRNYSREEARIVVKEMTDALVLDLVEKHLITDSVTLAIMYDHRFGHPGSAGTVNLGYATSSGRQILGAIDRLYERIVEANLGVRRIQLCANRVVEEGYIQWNLFQDPEEQVKERRLQDAVLELHQRYGKSSVMRGISLLDCATTPLRNRQIGGHWA